MEKQKKDTLNGHKAPAVVAVLSAVIGSSGAPFLLVKLGVNPYRADAYTATMAEVDQENINRRIGEVANYIDRHLNNHPDTANKFETRISKLEAQNELILVQLNRIITRLDK